MGDPAPEGELLNRAVLGQIHAHYQSMAGELFSSDGEDEEDGTDAAPQEPTEDAIPDSVVACLRDEALAGWIGRAVGAIVALDAEKRAMLGRDQASSYIPVDAGLASLAADLVSGNKQPA